MNKCCKICKLSNENDEGAVLFQAPQEGKKRKTWSKACGVFLTKDCLLCQNHFDPNDIIGRRFLKLKHTALPISEAVAANKNTMLKVEDSTAGTALSESIKPEPPELVLVNPKKSDDESNTEMDAFLDVAVKVELKETTESLELINEEQFDSRSDRLTPISTKEMTNTNVNVKSPQKTAVLTCGRIDLEISENTTNYKLRCNYCDTQIPIENWNLFVEHMTSTHKTSDDKIEDSLCKNDSNDNNDVNEDEESWTENINNETQDSNFDENNTSIDESDDLEPKRKRAKKESTKLISFSRSSKENVLGLLELLKSHAILWHRRQCIKERFDETLKEVTKEFNTKFPLHQLTEEEIRISIARIKYLYRRVTDTKHKQTISRNSIKDKFSEYFQLCDDIEEQSTMVKAKCETCGVSFLDERNLQTHSYYVHQIGELHFKCERCQRLFSTAARLKQHEKKHTDKIYNCEYCKRTFDQEKEMHKHLRMHTGSKEICEICGKQFENAYRYRRHKLHHEPPTLKCEICGKMLYEKYTLSEHMKSHQNERQYMCGICHKTFNRQNGLAIHKRSVHKITTQYVWAK